MNYYFQKKEKSLKIFYNKRLDKIEELNNKINYDNLIYVTVNSDKIFDFFGMKDSLTLLDGIKKGKTSLEKAKNNQQIFLDHLNIIRKGNKNNSQKKP